MMEKLHETLLILDHFEGVIAGRKNYCKRNIGFNLSDCVSKELNEKMKVNHDINSISKISNEISRKCTDRKIILNSYISLNFIDMFSFNDEYTKFFNTTNFEDENIQKRILNVLKNNSEIKKKIDWEQLRKFRNNVLAHNLRDKQNYYKLSINTLKELSGFLNNLKASIEYCEVISEMFVNIENEFKNELIDAKKELERKYYNNYK